MTTYFITRHTGALQWAAAHDIHFDIHLEHLLSLDKLQAGDVIIGTLPINMIYQIMFYNILFRSFEWTFDYFSSNCIFD